MLCVFEKVTESFSYFTCNWVFLVILSSEILFFRKWHVKKARALLEFNHLISFFGLWIGWILSIDVIQPFSLNVKLFKLRSGICCAILRSWAVGETQINRTSTNDQMSRSHGLFTRETSGAGFFCCEFFMSKGDPTSGGVSNWNWASISFSKHFYDFW